MALQETRLIFKHIDEEGYTNDIDCYVKNGGYEQLKKAVTMKPEDICEESTYFWCAWSWRRGFPSRDEVEVSRPQVGQAHLPDL